MCSNRDTRDETSTFQDVCRFSIGEEAEEEEEEEEDESFQEIFIIKISIAC
jgi:hypothetical protein